MESVGEHMSARKQAENLGSAPQGEPGSHGSVLCELIIRSKVF